MNSIKNAQESLLNCIKTLPYGNLLITLAPLFMIIEGVDVVFSLLGFGVPSFVSYIFSILYYGYLLSLVVCFASNSIIFMLGIFGLKALNSLVSIFKGLFAEYSYFSFYSLISFLGYGLLAYIFYYLLTKRASEN